jgi:effector-binding domain-containing protein
MNAIRATGGASMTMKKRTLRWMQRLAFVLSSTGAATGAALRQDTPLADTEKKEAESLLAAQRAGLGDPRALAELGVVRSHGKVSFEGFPSEGSFTEILAPNGAAREEALFEGIPPSVRGTNGELYWMIGTGGVEIKKGWSAAADVRLFALGRHRDWREVYSRAELVGEAEINGRACHELRLVPKSPAELGIEVVPGEEPPAPDSWWLDRGTKELVRAGIYATVSGVGWQRLVIDYSDWRPVGGVRFPYKARLTFGPPDQPLVVVTECESLEVDVHLDGDPFQPDEQVFAELARGSSALVRRDPGFSVQPRKPMRTATVRVTCKPNELQQQLAIILPEVMGYLVRERLTPVGAPFARYHSFGAEIDLEAGIPVAEEIAGSQRVKPSTLPGGDVVSGMHVGPYHELVRTHEALAEWLVEQRLTAEGGPWEVYWTDPGLERDPSKWRTEIFQPVSGWTSAEVSRAADTGATRRINTPKSAAAAVPDPRLVRLGNAALGEWKVEGGPEGPSGTLVFEWLEGGHFLVQHVDLVHAGHRIQGIEIIGIERPFGSAPKSSDLKSRFYDNLGNTLDYTWELEGHALTIWGGEKGSPMAYRGTFSEDGNTLTGGWKWPGGGFDLVGTRVLSSGESQLDSRSAE